MTKKVSNKKNIYINLRQTKGVDCVDGSESVFLFTRN
jgi:hypothetical protein